jgi:ABC-2 type transport system permease protein
VIFAPVFLAMLAAVGIAMIKEIEIPWEMFGDYTALLAAMAACFLGLGMLISALAYPMALGLLAAALGYFIFRRGDLP